MQEHKEFISSIASFIIIVIGSIISFLLGIIIFFTKRTLKQFDESKKEQDAEIDSIKTQLNELQGEHNALCEIHERRKKTR